MSDRGKWGNQVEFLLSCVGYAVGLGNVWRFPYLCYRNGGGAFLIPYVIMLTFVGLPLFFMEMSLGQFGSLGPISIWKVSPIFKGIGWGMVVISGMVCVYYNVIIAWTIYYLFSSFTATLPWETCDNDWNTPNCMVKKSLKDCSKYNLTTNCTNATATSPSQEFFDRKVLQITSGLEEPGWVHWQMLLCLLLAWIIVFLCLIKGIKSSGKVVYFTAVFPYVVLIILCIRNATLEGSLDGVLFYITPKWETLTQANVWKDAATQIFYSLGVSFGGLELFASYNKFHNNVCRDAIIVAVINCATSVFAGFVIFSVLGFMAQNLGMSVADVADSGPGLAFVAYPQGIAMMPISPLWAILFFFMLFFLGLDSQFAMMETVITGLVDEFDYLKKNQTRKTLTALALCILFFLLGIPCITQGGMYLFNLIDWYSASFSLMTVALIETIALNWIYGFSRFGDDIRMMIGSVPNIYWRACWQFISPALIIFILVFSAVKYAPATYGTYEYPWWGILLGWGMVLFPLVMIIIFALVAICNHGLGNSFRPQPDWGPANEEDRTGRYAKAIPMDAIGVHTVVVPGEKTGYPTQPSYPTINAYEVDNGVPNAAYVSDINVYEKTKL